MLIAEWLLKGREISDICSLALLESQMKQLMDTVLSPTQTASQSDNPAKLEEDLELVSERISTLDLTLDSMPTPALSDRKLQPAATHRKVHGGAEQASLLAPSVECPFLVHHVSASACCLAGCSGLQLHVLAWTITDSDSIVDE